MESSWPLYDYQPGVGAYGGLDDRNKRRKRKNPVGFAPPKPRPKKRKGRNGS